MSNPSSTDLSAAQKRALLAQLLEKKAQQQAAQENNTVQEAAKAQPQATQGNGEASRSSESPVHGPLSYGQRALWFLHQSDPHNTAYNVSIPARIQGELAVAALQSALAQLCDRHSLLRTTFHSQENGEPFQQVHHQQPIAFQVVDAQGWSDETLNDAVIAAHRQPFDLENGPVFRTTLFTQAPDAHVLLISLHHIVYDAWSLSPLLRDLEQLYLALKTGTEVTPTPLSASFVDYVTWQNEQLSGPAGDRLWSYWQETLSGHLPTLDLPTDRPHSLQENPLEQTQLEPSRQPASNKHAQSGAASYSFALNPDQVQSLKKLARDEGTTLYTLLMAAFQSLLYRYTGQSDILVGSPVGGRPQQAFENIVGYFVNPVVIRGQLSDPLTFQAFLHQMQATVLGAIEHQGYPFPLLVERLNPARDGVRSPLFQVLFNFLQLQKIEPIAQILVPPVEANATAKMVAPTVESANESANMATHESVKWADVTLHSFPLEQQEDQFDLSLELFETEAALTGVFHYSRALFDTETIERMAGHFQTLLQGIVADPTRPISRYPLLTAAEEHQLSVTFNQTRADYPQHLCLHQLVEAQVQRTPQKVALVFESEQLTYQQLDQQATRLANYLKTLGVGPDMLVGVCIERSADMVVAVLAVLKAGSAYVPLDPAYPQERLMMIATDAQFSVVLTQSHLQQFAQFRDQFKDKNSTQESAVQLKAVDIDTLDIDTLNLDAFDAETSESLGTGLDTAVTPDHLAYIIYTSGSTGVPKGVQIPHRNAVNLLHSVQKQPGLTEQDTLLAVASLSFDISVAELFLPLMVGAKLVVVSQAVTTDAYQLQAAMEQHQPTFMQPTPATWRMLLAAGWQGSPQLKIISTGEPLPQDLAAQLLPLGKELWNLYGPTETTIWSAGYQITEVESGPITIGMPIDNTQLHILDAHDQRVPMGIAGELFIGGDGLARGYLNRAELSAERFVDKAIGEVTGEVKTERLYRTGDLARWLPNGQVECLGRMDYQVKLRGFRIELGEIEQRLNQHPAVQQSVVVAREDQPGNNPGNNRGDKRLVAYVVTKEQGAIQDAIAAKIDQPEAVSGEQLRDFLSQQLPDYMIPAAFVFLTALPLTPNGKVDRRALPQPQASDMAALTAYVAPQTSTEKALATIWESLLNVQPIGLNDNFFSLGGHSLLAVQVIAQIRETLSVEVPLPMLFESATLAMLSDRIDTLSWALSSPAQSMPSAELNSVENLDAAVDGDYEEGLL